MPEENEKRRRMIELLRTPDAAAREELERCGVSLNLLTLTGIVEEFRIAQSSAHVILSFAERADSDERRWLPAIALNRDVAERLANELAEVGAEYRRRQALMLAYSEWRNLIWGTPAWGEYKHEAGFSLERSWRHPDH